MGSRSDDTRARSDDTRRDDLGDALPGAPEPARIVSLVPSLTEAIASVAAHRLVGATDYCSHPADLDVERVGGSKFPRLADVLALRPDLVIANAEENRAQDIAALRGAGLAVWVTAPGTVAAALTSMRHMFTVALGVPAPDWLDEADRIWAHPDRPRARAVIPVWRRPWVVLGRNTFAADVLRHIGIVNVYDAHPERYPRPPIEELRGAGADLVVLPDEPYEFSADDGPEAFPELPAALVSGRHLTWYGPSLVQAREVLARQVEPALRP